MFVFSKIADVYRRVKKFGHTAHMDPYEKQKLSIFNQINFFGFLTGIGIPLSAYFGDGYLPPLAWIVASSPTVISFIVLLCNYKQKYELAMMAYFVLYPLDTALVYAGSIDAGIELFFILYAILSVFYLKRISNMVLSFLLSFGCYFVVFVFHKHYQYKLEEVNFMYYLLNQAIAVAFIFMSMYLIKKENSLYQKKILAQNNALYTRNNEIAVQKKELAQKAMVLEKTTEQLTELDALKNKLFSVISHDLKTPIYSLRNLFRNVQQYDLPGEEIKVLLPDIMNDLNYTTGLMENLLQWAKSQMQGSSLNLQLLDVSLMIKETSQLLRLQAESKNVQVKFNADKPVYIFADKDMIDLVLRNLLSNAIKFTPPEGEVRLGATQTDAAIEIFVQDTGMGISPDNINKLFGNNFFTTKGTSNETGTGLGLVLCREFLHKNGGDITVESVQGKGSKFKFTLPIP
jgi:two-component system, sensor histidine kinase and response regulator